MFRLSTKIAALLAATSLAEEENKDKHYKRFGDLMDYFGFTWEAIEVTTEDGYILTTFHVTGNSEGLFTPTMPPVLIQHGDASDGAAWLSYYYDGVPMHLQLAEAGYDVYIGNNRGTEYSQQHVSLTTDDPEYWAWSWGEMGIYDDVANIKMMKEESGAEKVFYLGWSQGTVQMFYALAHREEEFFKDNLYKFVALAPCTICPEDGPESYFEETLYSFPSVGVYDLYGPHWNRDYNKVCRELGQDACDYASCDWCEPEGVQSEMHWWQNTYTNRFQEFAPNYASGERETELINIAGIDKVPIAMVSGTEDVTCPYATALETAAIIGDMVTHFESIPGQDHGYFGGANDEWYMNLITSLLQVPKEKAATEEKEETISILTE